MTPIVESLDSGAALRFTSCWRTATLGLGRWMLVPALVMCGCSPQADEPASSATSGGAHEGSSHEPEPQHARPYEPLLRFEPSVHMQADFWAAVDARDAIIDGDLDRAQKAMGAIVKHDYRSLVPESWIPWVDQMQEAARVAAGTNELPGAAQAVASLGLKCGGCHAALDGGPRVDEEEDQGFAPEGPEELETRMGRHEWAADELWLGLVMPSEKLWASGARILIEAPREPLQWEGRPVVKELGDAIEAVRAVGERARQATTDTARAKVYGDLLTTCSSCHGQLMPPPPNQG